MKISRNANCPCGSGRKYKQCCLGKASVERKSTPQSQELLNAVKVQAATHPFASIEEVQAFANQQLQLQNNRPVEDFEGLSPSQMGALLGQLPGRDNLVQLTASPDVSTTPFIQLFELLVAAIGDKGLKATATGNLPRKFCRDAALSFLGEEGYATRTRYGGINTEPDFGELHVMRINAEFADLIKLDRGQFLLTCKGREILASQSYAGAYLPLLKAFTDEYNWAYRDRYDDHPFIQQSWMFSLWLLQRYGDTEREIQFYKDKYIRAFPVLLDQVEDSPYQKGEIIIKNVYSLRTFHLFLVLFGLIDIRKHDPSDILSESSIKARELFSKVVKFSI